MDLQIDLQEVEDNVILRIDGRLDTLTSPALAQKLDALIEEKHVRLLIDFTRIDYLSSAGMRLLLSAMKKTKSEKGYLVLFGISDDVMEIIKMAGFDRILILRKTEKEALQYRP